MLVRDGCVWLRYIYEFVGPNENHLWLNGIRIILPDEAFSSDTLCSYLKRFAPLSIYLLEYEVVGWFLVGWLDGRLNVTSSQYASNSTRRQCVGVDFFSRSIWA